jgi:hypothetical protein
MDILNSYVSYFDSITETEVVRKAYSVADCIKAIKEGEFKKTISKVRAGRDDLKKDLPAVAVHGIFRDYRRGKDFILASGLIVIDIDDTEDSLEDVKQDIMESFDYVFAAMVSPSGNGIKVLCYVDPNIVTAESYREIGKSISKDFVEYGTIDYLSITDCLIMSWDPDILVNENPNPATVYLKEKVEKKVELEPVDKNKKLWTDVEEFFSTVLADSIAEKSSNNYHYLQMAMLDLSKYGFNHPKEDLSFVIDYAEAVHKKSSSNQGRFLELVEICKSYPQTCWPYRTVRDEEDEYEEPIDYSQYAEPKEKKKVKATKSLEDDDDLEDEEEDESDGLINYEDGSFWKRILEVAQEGDRVGAEISLQNFADIFRFRGSGILTVTGIPGHGKAQPLNSLIQTPNGAVKMGDIKVGQTVLTKNGSTVVSGVYPQGLKDIYTITFNDSSIVRSCKEHLWQVVERGNNGKKEEKIVPLEDMINNLTLNGGKKRFSIPIFQSQYEDRDLPLDPYMLGVLLGDGCLAKGSIKLCTSEKEIEEYFSKELDKIDCKIYTKWINKCTSSVISKKENGKSISYVEKAIIDLGLRGDFSTKFIPEIYLHNSVEKRMEILRGIMDTDGCIDKNKAPYLSTSSKRLSEDFKHLVQSLGGVVRVSSYYPSYTYRGKKLKSKNETYHVGITLPKSLGNPFLRSQFKRDRWETMKYKEPMRLVNKIELTSYEEAQCIMVEDESHLYLTDDFIVTHNTEFIDQCILDLARLYGHETLVAGFEQSAEEHVLKLSQKLLGKNPTCKTFLTKQNIPTLKKAVDYITSKIKHIDTIKHGGEIVRLLEIAAKKIHKSRQEGTGVKYLVIDPYNMLSLKGSKLNGYEKVEEILRKITHFSHQMDVMVILIAHPVKIKKDPKTGAYEVPDFYSVKGSSAFFEMSYHGIVIFRHGYKSSDTILARILKVKQSKLGKTMADANFTFDANSTRYVPIDEEGNVMSGDHYAKNWLEKALEKEHG